MRTKLSPVWLSIGRTAVGDHSERAVSEWMHTVLSSTWLRATCQGPSGSSDKPPHNAPVITMRLDAHDAYIHVAFMGRAVLDKARGLCGYMHSRLSLTWLPMGKTTLPASTRGAQVAWFPESTDAPAPTSRGARAAACGRSSTPRGLSPAGCRRRGLSLSDFAKSGVKDPQPPPYPPVDGGREARVLGPLILTP